MEVESWQAAKAEARQQLFGDRLKGISY